MGKPNHNKLKRSPIDINGSTRSFTPYKFKLGKKDNVCKQYTRSLLRVTVWICRLFTNYTKLGYTCLLRGSPLLCARCLPCTPESICRKNANYCIDFGYLFLHNLRVFIVGGEMKSCHSTSFPLIYITCK